MITHKRVEEMLQEEIKRAKEAGIPISCSINPVINFPKATSFYGMCCPSGADPEGKYCGKFRYGIRISEYYLQAPKESLIRETLMHELIHTCPDCLNHGKVWKKWAKVANDTYGYSIERCSSKGDFDLRKGAEKKGRTRATIKHKVSCPGCGTVWYRTRHSNLTLHAEEYTCGCGHKGLRLEY